MGDLIRVLVVDDDFRVADLHRNIVAARTGVAALAPVHSLAAARDAVLSESPDLLLVDAYLPDGMGSTRFARAGRCVRAVGGLGRRPFVARCSPVPSRTS